jgi:dihydroflavonol-4-reductase
MSDDTAQALVTGGDGLLGSHLVRELIRRGIAVRVLVQPGGPSSTLRGLPAEFVAGDLLDADGAVEEAARGCRYVFHCAAITDLWADPALVWRVNEGGTKRVLAACARAGVRRLVFTGSASSFQFGTLDAPGGETGNFPAAYRGVPYMESKRRAAEFVREAARRGEVDAVIVAPTFMLGDLDSRPSSGELIRQFIARGLRVTSPGGRNFVYAGDVAVAMANALDRGRSGESYLAGGWNLPYREFFAEVARIAGVRPPSWVLPGPALVAVGALASAWGRLRGTRPPLDLRTARLARLGTYYDARKAVAELGMPRTSVQTGIERTLAGLREFGHLPPADRK